MQEDSDSKVYGANIGTTWVLSAPDGPLLAPWTFLSGDVTYNILFILREILFLSVAYIQGIHRHHAKEEGGTWRHML